MSRFPRIVCFAVFLVASAICLGAATYEEAEALQDAEQYATAQDAFLEFIEANPADERVDKARLEIGEIAEKSGEYAAAITQYEGLLSQHPDSPLAESAWISIAKAYDMKRDSATAAQKYE